MFSWIRSWFGGGSKWDVYSPAQRQIYSYSDGGKLVRADPLVLYKRLMDVITDLRVDFQVARSPMKNAAEGHDKAMAKIRNLFQVEDLDGGGLTDSECDALLTHFMQFTEVLKKNLNRIPTSRKATSAPTASSPDEGPPTTSGSASGSAASEPTTDSQERSPGESPLPSACSTPDPATSTT